MSVIIIIYDHFEMIFVFHVRCQHSTCAKVYFNVVVIHGAKYSLFEGGKRTSVATAGRWEQAFGYVRKNLVQGYTNTGYVDV